MYTFASFSFMPTSLFMFWPNRSFAWRSPFQWNFMQFLFTIPSPPSTHTQTILETRSIVLDPTVTSKRDNNICTQPIQLLSRVQLFVTPWTAACQAFLSSNNFQNIFKLMSIESVMPSNNLILCLPLHTIKSYKKYPSIIPLKFKVFIFFSIIKHFSVNRIKISSQQQWENFQVSFIKYWDIIDSLGKVKWNEVSRSCPTLCDTIDCSLPGSSVRGIFQAIVLEWIAISFSRGSSQPRARTRVSLIVDRRFTVWATREANVVFKSQHQLMYRASTDLKWPFRSFFSSRYAYSDRTLESGLEQFLTFRAKFNILISKKLSFLKWCLKVASSQWCN